MFARVRIAGPWHLATFKDDLPDAEERDELEDAVLEILRPILEKCSAASMSARIEMLTKALNDMIPPRYSGSRPKKTKKEPAPGSKQKRRSGTVAAEKSDPQGPAKSLRTPQDSFTITFDGDAERDGVGAFVAGRPHRVNLSREHPYIARLIQHRDEPLGKLALYAQAIALFLHGCHIEDPELPFVTFGQQIAKILAMQDIEMRDLVKDDRS